MEQKKKDKKTLQDMIQEFFNIISEGSLYVYVVCVNKHGSKIK